MTEAWNNAECIGESSRIGSAIQVSETLSLTKSDWWFGTFVIFHNIWDVILPIVELIFFKMVIAPPTRYKGLQGPPLIIDTPPMLKDIVEIVFFTH